MVMAHLRIIYSSLESCNRNPATFVIIRILRMEIMMKNWVSIQILQNPAALSRANISSKMHPTKKKKEHDNEKEKKQPFFICSPSVNLSL